MKFLCIFHSNLDEFFMIRVSGLHDQLEASVTERSADGLSPIEQLRAIGEIVRRDLELATKTLTEDVLPKLAEKGVRILAWDAIEAERRKELTAYFESVVFPVLTPLAFDPAHPFPVRLEPLAFARDRALREGGRPHPLRARQGAPFAAAARAGAARKAGPRTSSSSRTSSRRTCRSSSRA